MARTVHVLPASLIQHAVLFGASVYTSLLLPGFSNNRVRSVLSQNFWAVFRFLCENDGVEARVYMVRFMMMAPSRTLEGWHIGT